MTLSGDDKVSGQPSNVALVEALKSKQNRESFNEILEMARLLNGCIIDNNYVIPDALSRPIRLTEFGEQMLYSIAERRKRVKLNELRMAEFLTFGCADGLLVSVDSDMDAMRKALSIEVKKGRILFPYIFGRDLHDKAAELYPEKTTLNNRETITLLKALPVGVFQAGYSVVGPYGCLASEQRRALPPATAHVPGYRCSDETCENVHPISLATGRSAIRQTRRIVDEYIEKEHSGVDDENARLIVDACIEIDNPYRLQTCDTLIETISDGFTLDEIRLLTDCILRASFRDDGTQPEMSRKLGAVIGNPTEFVATLDRASLLQIILLHTDSSILEAIDRAIYSGILVIPPSELKIPKLARWGEGYHGLCAEIGSNGVRFKGPVGAGVPARRLYELLHHLYFASDMFEPADLQYALGQAAAPNGEELLGFAIRTLTPDLLLERLVLGTRKPALEAARLLQVTDAENLDKEVLLKRMLWKLGVASPEPIFVDLQRIANLIVELENSLQLNADEADLRGIISNLFTAMESALTRALAFSVWALTTDHYLESASFIYGPGLDLKAFVFIEKNAPVGDSGIGGLKLDGKNTLMPLAAGFSRLGKALRALDPDEYRRPAHQIPLECRCTPKPFAFPYTIPYLCLTQEGKAAMVTTLQELSQLLQDAIVVKVRNSTMHGNNDFPSHAEIGVAIEKISRWRDILVVSGIYPQVYVFESRRSNAWGTVEAVYRNDDQVLELNFPLWSVAPGLPNAGPRMIAMPAAIIPSAGPLRFAVGSQSRENSYWKDWPKRWRITTSYSVDHRASSDVAEHGTAAVNE